MRRTLGWVIPAVVGTGLGILLLWSTRPTWGYCVDGPDPATSGCDTGTLSLAAVLGTVVLVVLLAAFVVLAVRMRGPARTGALAIGAAVLVAALLWSLAAQTIWPIEHGPSTVEGRA